MIAAWPCPGGEEYALAFDRNRPKRVLVLPAWFDEGNKLRHFTVEVMRRLDGAGVDSFLPDLPGCNESLAPLEQQTLQSWRAEAAEAAWFFSATHVLAIRAALVNHRTTRDDVNIMLDTVQHLGRLPSPLHLPCLHRFPLGPCAARITL